MGFTISDLSSLDSKYLLKSSQDQPNPCLQPSTTLILARTVLHGDLSKDRISDGQEQMFGGQAL
jgi:hypothetical protein